MLGGLPGLGIRTVFAVFHCCGSLPVRQHWFLVRASIAVSFKFLNALLLTWSGPDADLQLIVCRTARTSHSSMLASSLALVAPS